MFDAHALSKFEKVRVAHVQFHKPLMMHNEKHVEATCIHSGVSQGIQRTGALSRKEEASTQSNPIPPLAPVPTHLRICFLSWVRNSLHGGKASRIPIGRVYGLRFVDPASFQLHRQHRDVVGGVIVQLSSSACPCNNLREHSSIVALYIGSLA